MSTGLPQRAGIQRQIQLPNSEAIKIAARSLKIRFWRSLITMAGIVLAIAFLTYVTIAGVIERGFRVEAGNVEAIIAQQNATRIWLIVISLLVCVVGISNAMLMSVTERYREIGTMKCLGALDWFVVKLFLIEALFQGLVGSLIGALIGLAAAFVAGLTEHGSAVFTEISWSGVLLRFVLAIAIGGVLSVIGAVYPARRAGKMPPADAMRTEI